jgi:hypothetical protein
MRRGKVIGALVLLAAIGLVVILMPERREEAGSAATDATPGAAVIAQADPAATGQAPAEPRLYTVDPAQSEVYWRIYRAGAAARLGHNHVISVAELNGLVTLGSDLAAAQWELSFPVADLVVDDPGIRARHGDDFSSVPSDRDKEGTKRNMLTSDVLDAEAYPAIRLSGRGVFGSLESADLPAAIEILGRVVERRFPASIVIGADSVTVTGEYRLTHTDLGMTPFTALGGLMAVGEEIDFTYRIHAVAGAP